MTPSETALPCRAPGPPAMSWGCYFRVVTWVSSSDRLAGREQWHTASHGNPLSCASSASTAHTSQCSLVRRTFSAAASQTSSLHPGTKRPLCARRFALLITCSCTSWFVLKPHTPASRPCPVLLALFHSPGHINIDFLHSPSLNVFFYLPGENFALVALKVYPNGDGKVGGEAIGL